MKRKASPLTTYQGRLKRRRTAPKTPRLRNLKPSNDPKYTDTVSTVTVGAAGTMANLWGALSQGTNDDEFIGRRIQPIAVEFRYSWTVADTTNICRHMILQWGDNSAAPVVGNVLTSLNAISAKNRNYESEITLHRDSLFGLKLYTTAGSGDIAVGKEYIKGPKLLEGSINLTTALWKNGLWLLMITDSAVAANPGFTFWCRTHFLDA